MQRDPTMLFQPWVGLRYPGFTPNTMCELRWSTYVAMWDSVKGAGAPIR